MRTLIFGENGSGKSDYAERFVMGLGDEKRLYLATMIACDENSIKRIERHRKLREGRGFETLECPLDIGAAPVGNGANVLLEDLCNLVANEIFETDGRGAGAVVDGIEMLSKKCAHLTVVSNTFFENTDDVSDETRAYISSLYEINEKLEEIFDNVIRIENGRADVLKGKGI